MIKISYESLIEGMDKPEHTLIRIKGDKMFVQYDVPNKAEQTVKKMKQDGRKNVLFSRGLMIQWFQGKDEKEILAIAKKDIKNGVLIAEKASGKKPTIKNLKIDES